MRFSRILLTTVIVVGCATLITFENRVGADGIIPSGQIRNRLGMMPASIITILPCSLHVSCQCSDTPRIQQQINAAAAGTTIHFTPGEYKIGRIYVESKSISIIAHGATFRLKGDKAGFVFCGRTDGFSFLGGRIVGDGVDRGRAPITAQVGILVGDEPGARVSFGYISGVSVERTNIGYKISDGRRGGGPTVGVSINDCVAKNIQGSSPGVGYGFQLTQAPYSRIIDCVAFGCGRHGIYISEGAHYTITRCRVTQCGTFPRLRGAVAISRSRDVGIFDTLVYDNSDAGLVIDDDQQGLAPDNDLREVMVYRCEFARNVHCGIMIGTALPVTDGVPRSIIISSTRFYIGAVSKQGIRLVSAHNVMISRNSFIKDEGGGAPIVWPKKATDDYMGSILISEDNEIQVLAESAATSDR